MESRQATATSTTSDAATGTTAADELLPGVAAVEPAAAAAPAAAADDGEPDVYHAGPDDPNKPINWPSIEHQLYLAVSAGPHAPHPLPETYYASYAIWYKQWMMLDAESGDDELGSRLAAIEVTHAMLLEGVRPLGGTVWGTPAQLAHWREHCNDNPRLHEEWSELVLAHNAWQDGYFAEEDAAWRMATLPSDAEAITVPGPWGFSGDRAQQERALELAELLEKAASAARREMRE